MVPVGRKTLQRKRRTSSQPLPWITSSQIQEVVKRDLFKACATTDALKISELTGHANAVIDSGKTTKDVCCLTLEAAPAPRKVYEKLRCELRACFAASRQSNNHLWFTARALSWLIAGPSFKSSRANISIDLQYGTTAVLGKPFC